MLLQNTNKYTKRDEKNENTELANAFMRVDRSHKNILSLKKKLNSYTCEPRTYEMYNQLDDLKLKLEMSDRAHLSLMDSFRQPTHFIEVQLQQVQENVVNAKNLEQGVLTYMNLAK